MATSILRVATFIHRVVRGLLFLLNVPGATFILPPMSIPNTRLAMFFTDLKIRVLF